MSDWTEGYVAEIDYTYGYYTELNPLRVKLAFINAALVCPEFGTACELGFGQGISTNFHASASVTNWHGTDFNPSQASFAQDLAKISGSNARLYDEAFSDFANRPDLPDFDYIGLHGIWSWISDENRAVIVEFIRRKLKVGGVVYISYNTLPGWSSFAPVRHLMTEHANVLGADGVGIASRIDGALEFTEKLLATNPTYTRDNPLAASRFTVVKNQSRHYLAHEYFNRDWHPMYFSKMSEWMSEAKLSFACSANYLDFVDKINLTEDQQKFLENIEDPIFKQTVRDFMVNTQFRKDYWTKGPRKMSALEQAEAFRAQRIVLTTAREDILLEVRGTLGAATLSEDIYSPILNFLSDHKSHSIAEIEQVVNSANINYAKIIQAVMVLMGSGHLESAQDIQVISHLKKNTDSINKHLLSKARSSEHVSYLVSPVTGGGITVGRFLQLYLLAIKNGKKKPEDWAEFVWNILSTQGHKLIKDGNTLQSAEENLKELTLQADIFAKKQLPILKALMVA